MENSRRLHTMNYLLYWTETYSSRMHSPSSPRELKTCYTLSSFNCQNDYCGAASHYEGSQRRGRDFVGKLYNYAKSHIFFRDIVYFRTKSCRLLRKLYWRFRTRATIFPDNVSVKSKLKHPPNLRSGVPFIFVGAEKERLIQLLDYSSVASPQSGLFWLVKKQKGT